MSTHEDRRNADDGSWPILQRNEPKPKFELYEPDYQYWPHSPLPEKSTVYEKLRRLGPRACARPVRIALKETRLKTTRLARHGC